ncbi:MAG: PDZ domain-containing protein [Burkholderiales bacterium]|nr:PDZ domain-containing protein [Burkholderiales bacterium]
MAPLPAYLRQPAIAGDTLVFVADDDLWRVDAAGGTASRLTTGLSEPATPCLNPDGRWLAFAGRDEQHTEVWLMSAAGGPARRLTWLGSELAVRGFTPEGRILFCCNHGQPFFRHWHAWSVDVQGGAPERLPIGAVDHLAFGPQTAQGRALLIGRNTGDPARWKRYRGGRTGSLWIDAAGEGRFRRLTELAGNLSSPMWIGERLWFLGDGDGVGNLHSCRPDGSGLRQHTFHRDFYARHASSDGRRIVYQQAGALWLLDPARDADGPRRLDITVPSARTQAARHFVETAEQLQGANLHPQGHSVVAEVRGQTFTMALWEGAVRHLGQPGARQRLARWLADGTSLVAVSDASGEEQLVLLAGPPAEAALGSGSWDIGRAHALVPAPSGRRVAIANHRNELLVADLDAGTLTRADASEYGRIEDPVWSPCGGWLAYTKATSTRHTAIALHECAAARTVLATTPEFRDYAPAFDPAGRYLYFLSLRTFDPVYDSVQFELSFPRAGRPYLIALQAAGRAPFEPEPRGLAPTKDGSGAPAAATPPPPIEPEGLARRVAAFPVAEGRFGQIAGVADAKVVWTQLPVQSAHGRGGHKDGAARLERFDFASGEVVTLVAACDGFVAAADGHTLLLRHGSTLRAVDAGGKPDEGKPDATPSRKSGVVDLARIRVAVEPPREWAQMLREVWRLQRDQFWVEDMSGVDWHAVYSRYEPLLAQVATRGELSDLIWELQGELGTSHAYEMGGDHRKPPAVALGRLAAELRPAADADGCFAGWEIVRTVQGDAWDAEADSPLNAIGVAARAGECIVAVDGQPTTVDEPPAALLVAQAGAKVALTLASADGTSRREVTVRLLTDETPARYREWVERNRAQVHAASGGRVGYLHLPDMMGAGFAEFHRYFGTECDRDALVVDLRFNRGGHVSQLLLEKVARKRIAWNRTRWGRPTPYPDEAPAGPVVALTNEHAGSDGDIFSHGFKLMGVGKLVGQRTWGGVIGIWPRHKLVDGTETTQPEYSFWFRDVGWGVENHGTEPQIEVDNLPEDDAYNAPERDRQLARAVAEALAAIQTQGVARPVFGPPPRLGPRTPD